MLRADARGLSFNKSPKIRSNRGAAVLALTIMLGLIILPALTFLSFEIARVVLAKQQLQNATDAATLTAVAQLASSNNSDPYQAHSNAVAAAQAVFAMNYLLGSRLTNSSIVASSSALSCNPGEAKLFFQFIDPATKSVVPFSSPNGKVIYLQSCGGADLAFGKYLGISNFQVNASSKGAVPSLDVEICFDVSGSMDDQTPVTFVKRYWDPTLPALDGSGMGRIAYQIPAGNTSTGTAEGTISSILAPPATGTSLNANFPQCLEESLLTTAVPGSTQPLTFTWDVGSDLRSLGGYPDAGKPPGNLNSPDPFIDHFHYTEVVANIDNQAHFGGFVYNGYSFPNLNTLCEAARGNLENGLVFQSSKANTSVTVTPRAGYQAAYQAAMSSILQPIVNSQKATQLFANILNTDTDCHFGLIAFDAEVGIPGATNPSEVIAGGEVCEAANSIDLNGYPSVNTNYPHPLITLNPSLGVTNYQSVSTALQSTVALGGTNIGKAIDAAVKDLQANGRPGSVKAIVLFTDGQPTNCGDDNGPLDADPLTNARLAAAEAGAAGIPVYTIGLAQTASIVPGETAILNDTNSNPTTGGIAAIAGHGGTFDLVTDSSQLQTTFEKIARRLVEIVATSGGDY